MRYDMNVLQLHGRTATRQANWISGQLDYVFTCGIGEKALSVKTCSPLMLMPLSARLVHQNYWTLVKAPAAQSVCISARPGATKPIANEVVLPTGYF